MEPKRIASSPRYSVPYIGRRTLAKGAFVRGAKGNVEHVFVGDGELTCKEMEQRCIETASSEGVRQTERNIVITEGDMP